MQFRRFLSSPLGSYLVALVLNFVCSGSTSRHTSEKSMPEYYGRYDEPAPRGGQFGGSRYDQYDEDDVYEGSDGGEYDFEDRFADLGLDDSYERPQGAGRSAYATEERRPHGASPPRDREPRGYQQTRDYAREEPRPRYPSQSYQDPYDQSGRDAYSGRQYEEDDWYEQLHPREDRTRQQAPQRGGYRDETFYAPPRSSRRGSEGRTRQGYRAEEVRPQWADAENEQYPSSPRRPRYHNGRRRHPGEPPRTSGRYADEDDYPPRQSAYDERAYSGYEQPGFSPGADSRYGRRNPTGSGRRQERHHEPEEPGYGDPRAFQRAAQGGSRRRPAQDFRREQPPREHRRDERRGSGHDVPRYQQPARDEHDDYPRQESPRRSSRRSRPQQEQYDDYPYPGRGAEHQQPRSGRGGYPSRGPGSSRAGRSTGPTRPQPSAAEKKARFKTYNEKWEQLNRTDPVYPLPRPSAELQDPSYLSMSAEDESQCTEEDAIIANVQNFFLGGFGLHVTFSYGQDQVQLAFSGYPPKPYVEALIKYLRRKEQPRWHPDRLNLRTGSEGRLDNTIGERKEVKAIRSAVQYLLDACTNALDQLQ